MIEAQIDDLAADIAHRNGGPFDDLRKALMMCGMHAYRLVGETRIADALGAQTTARAT